MSGHQPTLLIFSGEKEWRRWNQPKSLDNTYPYPPQRHCYKHRIAMACIPKTYIGKKLMEWCREEPVVCKAIRIDGQIKGGKGAAI